MASHPGHDLLRTLRAKTKRKSTTDLDKQQSQNSYYFVHLIQLPNVLLFSNTSGYMTIG